MAKIKIGKTANGLLALSNLVVAAAPVVAALARAVKGKPKSEPPAE